MAGILLPRSKALKSPCTQLPVTQPSSLMIVERDDRARLEEQVGNNNNNSMIAAYLGTSVRCCGNWRSEL
jgi:hypothetical protein